MWQKKKKKEFAMIKKAVERTVFPKFTRKTQKLVKNGLYPINADLQRVEQVFGILL